MVESTSASTPYSAQAGATFWFTGLSGAGKSTLSEYVKNYLDSALGDDKKVFILDGDIIRTGLNKGLGFSAEDRAENIRRISEVSKLFCMSGAIVFVAFISPYSKDRDFAKNLHKDAGLKFFECHISASLEVCEGRDVKGLYKKARAGIIPNFTGVSDPYQEPENCELNINTGEIPIEGCKNIVVNHMVKEGVIRDNSQPRVVESLIDSNEAKIAEAAGLPKLMINDMQVELVQTIGEGWAFPLTGFMNELELVESLQMKTVSDKNGKRHMLSVPLTQDISTELKNALTGCKAVALCNAKINGGKPIAVIRNPSFFANRKEEICARAFGCFSTNHPMANNITNQQDWLISGEMDFLCKVMWNDGMDKYRLTPKQIKEAIEAKQADACYAFQVRNPLHNGHCLLLKDTRTQLQKQGYKNPVLLLHPLGGWCKDDDVPLKERMDQHQALIDDGTLPAENIILAVWPSPMYYGGPTEVLWHASSRVGCGITHFITGRDPAGVKHPEKPVDLYDPWHGQKLLVHNKAMLNGVDVVPFKVAAYNKKSAAMEFFNPQAANAKDFEFISGSRMRQMAKDGVNPPSGFMSQKGWEVLAEYYKNL
jgi:3'-phosphoadenosine 5'-phosphosulfate synthase